MKIESIIFDFGRTIYDPDTNSLFPQTLETLESLSVMGIKLGLVSVAETENTDTRVKELDDLGVSRFFHAVDIVPRSTRVKDFGRILKELKTENAQNCLVVGDNLKREITTGNEIGAFTVWTRQNLSADWEPKGEIQIPKAIIDSIAELVPLVERLNR